MLWDILIAATVSLLILTILWVLRGLLGTPVPRGKNTTIQFQVRVKGHEPILEQTVEGLCWLIQNGTIRAGIEIVDCGMDLETQHMAQTLAGKTKVDFVRNDTYGQSATDYGSGGNS
jgi:hypothetical protein